MKIQSVKSWLNGEEVTATDFKLQSSFDNLVDSATFQYYLYSDKDEVEGKQVVSYGELKMNNPDYDLWNDSLSINNDAYKWAAAKLKLTIIEDYIPPVV